MRPLRLSPDTLDMIFLVQWDQPPVVKAADDLEYVVWINRDDVEYERIGFKSLRQTVRRYLEEEPLL